jgi:hypothetical protein
MPDLFISYAREDRDTAQALALALEAQGLDAWWDRELTGGGDFAQEIALQLKAATLVLVLWSEHAVASEFVRDESARARDAKKLLPVRITEVELPLGFGTLNTLDLLDWHGDDEEEGFVDLLAQVRARLAAGLGAGVQALPRAAEDGPTRRRQRRQWLLGGACLALAGSAGLGAWVWRRDQQQAEARDRLDQALQFHFARPPELDRARTAYSEATHLDPSLARAYYFWAHLLVQQLLEAQPPLQGEVLTETRQLALANFSQAIELARADARRLEGSQRAIAQQQVASLSAPDAAPPVARSMRAAASVALPADSPSAPAVPAPSKVASLALPAASSPVLQAQALFAPERDARLAAAGALTLDPSHAADVLPLAVDQANRLLRQGGLSASQSQGLTSTVALLQRASPATLQALLPALSELVVTLAQADDPAWRSAAADLRQRLQRSQGQAPIAYLQIAHERQRPLAQALARQLAQAGYLTPAIENTGEARAPQRPSVRSQGASDPGLGRWCQQALSRAAGAPAELVTLRQAHPATDVFELWFDRALCAPAGRAMPGCANAG